MERDSGSLKIFYAMTQGEGEQEEKGKKAAEKENRHTGDRGSNQFYEGDSARKAKT